MSSQTDIPAPGANIARLEARLKAVKETSASRIRELEDKVIELQIDVQMITPEHGDQASQPAVSTDASNQELRDEISRLQEEVAVKDAIIAQYAQTESDMLTTIGSYKDIGRSLIDVAKSLAATEKDADSILQAAEARRTRQSPRESTSRSLVADSAKSDRPNPFSLPKDNKGDSQNDATTLLAGSTPTKFPSEAAPRPNYAQRNLGHMGSSTRGRSNHGATAHFSIRGNAKPQAPSKAQRQQQSQMPNRDAGHGSRGGRDQSKREDSSPEAGSPFNDQPSKMHMLTLKKAGPESTQVELSAGAGMSALVENPIKAGARSVPTWDDLILDDLGGKPGLPEPLESALAFGPTLRGIDSRSSEPPAQGSEFRASPVLQALTPPSANLPGTLPPPASKKPDQELETREIGSNRAAGESNKSLLPKRPASNPFEDQERKRTRR